MDKANELRISDSLALPLDIVTDTIGILAIKGSGKTYTFLTLVEEMVRRNLPAVVIDTMGVCWAPREDRQKYGNCKGEGQFDWRGLTKWGPTTA